MMKIKRIHITKIFLIILFAVLAVMCFSACDSVPVVQKYYLDTNGNLIAEFEDGSTKDLGKLSDTIANGVENIEINSDGYYVINDIATDIQAKLPKSYSIDANGNLIVTYTDTTSENLGNFGNDIINTIDTIYISDDGFYVLNGVKTDIVAIEVYDVTFNTGYSAEIPKQTVKDGYKVERPELEREGYTLNGWYCNGEEWQFNSNIVKDDMTLTADWEANEYTVSFVTGIDSSESPITVIYDSPYTLPVLERTGYTFDGWLYNGNIVTDNKWSIATDCTLTAQWTENKYVVSLNANGGNVSPSSMEIEYGKPFALPVATNSYGAFIGWFYDGVQITDSEGNSLVDWTYTTDIEVTTSWTIEISSVTDLQLLYTYPNGHFELKNNLDISLTEWIPVGTEVKPFTGQIDGGNFAINGLKITQLQEHQKYYGLIGYSTSGKIFDLKLSNVNINLPVISNSIYVGSVIAKNRNATLENIIVSGNISIANHSSAYMSCAGGVIGYSETDYVKNCVNSANVTAKNIAGGIIGYKDITAETDRFIDNNNSGNVSAEIAGGVIGDGILCFAQNCCNTGNITGIRFAGGIIGRSDNIVIIDMCVNQGKITTTSEAPNTGESAGGIVGTISLSIADGITSYITNSYNIGEIVSVNDAGGILGVTTNPFTKIIIENCYNNGIVTGERYAGGIAGIIFSETIRQSVNYGTISADGLSATIAYPLPGYSLVITDCFYNCSTSGIDAVQGTRTTEKYSETFYTKQLFWDNTVWDFHTDKLPTLKIERIFNN